MPESRIIACVECGGPYETKRSNTKYCGVCRLARDLQFVGLQRAECWVCDAPFAPIEKREKTCPSHMYEAKKFGEAECAFCHKTALRVTTDVNVCNHCARDPEKRRAFYGSLLRKQAARQQLTKDGGVDA